MQQREKFFWPLLLLLVLVIVGAASTAEVRLKEIVQQEVTHGAKQGRSLLEDSEHFEFNVISDNFYYTLNRTSTVSWYEANYFCTEKGWNLISLASIADTVRLRGFVKQYNIPDRFYWTSGNSLENIHIWRWGMGGPALTYTNWEDGAPWYNNGPYCMKLSGKTFRWVDQTCYSLLNVICQKR